MKFSLPFFLEPVQHVFQRAFHAHVVRAERPSTSGAAPTRLFLDPDQFALHRVEIIKMAKSRGLGSKIAITKCAAMPKRIALTSCKCFVIGHFRTF
jgi:hypothetical protein